MDLYLPPPQTESVTPTHVTQICRLYFRDGQVASAQIEAGSRYQECTVIYRGATERLPVRYETADSVLLRVMFRSFARELRARFEEELIGSWDSPVVENDDGEVCPPDSLASQA